MKLDPAIALLDEFLAAQSHQVHPRRDPAPGVVRAAGSGVVSLGQHARLATIRAQLARARKIVIDLAQTRWLHESGLALLMMLHDRAWCLRDGIELVNCSAPLRARFNREVYPGTFNLT